MNDKLIEALEEIEMDARVMRPYVGQVARLGKIARGALAASKPEPQRCKTCDGTGDIHRIDGEYLGECPHCKPEPVGINGLTYAEESATASVLGIVNSKPEPQAQVAPKVVGYLDEFGNFEHGKRPWMEDEEKRGVKWEPLITLQSRREAMAAIAAELADLRATHTATILRLGEMVGEDLSGEPRAKWALLAVSQAIAKKDAALDVCVGVRSKVEAAYNDALEKYGANNVLTQDLGDVLDAITKAEEARKS